jgi:hypothetical protein
LLKDGDRRRVASSGCRTSGFPRAGHGLAVSKEKALSLLKGPSSMLAMNEAQGQDITQQLSVEWRPIAFEGFFQLANVRRPVECGDGFHASHHVCRTDPQATVVPEGLPDDEGSPEVLEFDVNVPGRDEQPSTSDTSGALD